MSVLEAFIVGVVSGAVALVLLWLAYVFFRI